jgi:hypothetical protein
MGHAVPQAPQFLASLLRSTQDPLQAVSIAAQVEEHWPTLHTSLAAHARPHMPQFFGSRSGSMQAPLQSRLSASHTHMPRAQILSASQTRPHMPQLR